MKVQLSQNSDVLGLSQVQNRNQQLKIYQKLLSGLLLGCVVGPKPIFNGRSHRAQVTALKVTNTFTPHTSFCQND
jgi:hypothetical protein